MIRKTDKQVKREVFGYVHMLIIFTFYYVRMHTVLYTSFVFK